jgi:phospholipase C
MAAKDLERLKQIKHIVVLMMENRSFDHMLGYLRNDGMASVDGLTGEESNQGPDGKRYPVHAYAEDETAFLLPGSKDLKALDPCHSPGCVRTQLSSNNGGFVRDFVEHKNPPKSHYGLPMGHYTAQHLPVYDYLARRYCVCDSWHSSIPGDTWPNRLYALSAQTAETVPHKLRILRHLQGLPIWKKLMKIPVYETEAFTRQLDDEQWRWYSHDPATLRAADGRYRNLVRVNRDNFAYFNRAKVSFATEAAEWLFVGDSFLDDAAKGQLRSVSWIDPNFFDLRVIDPSSDDDHPPADIRAGQALVLELYEALVNSPGWRDTLLVITYDEHGGFYDHVAPPAVDDGSGYDRLGVRVPALVVGPRVKNFVCKRTFDHTSLMKTILLRFAKDPDEAIAAMGARVKKAAHLGVALADEPRPDRVRADQLRPELAALRDKIDSWRERAQATRRAPARGEPSIAPDGAGRKPVMNDFQEDFAKFALALRASGLPPGQP